MAFVVETGAGLANATSYALEAEFTTYWTDRGNDDATNADSADVQVALILATDWVDLEHRFRGFKKLNTQALEWPREGVLTRTELAEVLSTTVPVEIKNATIEAAALALTEELLPNVKKAAAEVLSESKGARGLTISKTFKQAVNSSPILRKASRWLEDLRASDELLRG